MGLFNRRKQESNKERSKSIPISIPLWHYRSYNKDMFTVDTIVACVDALARNIGKMQLRSIRRQKDSVSITDLTSDVARVLKKPNKYMTSYDFLYKIAAMYYTTNNVFVWPEYVDGKLSSLWPINYRSFKLFKTESGVLVAEFNLTWRKTYTVPFDDLIVLRNHYFTDDVFGDSNEPLDPVGELLNAQSQGIIQGIANSAIVRGILKATQIMKKSDIDAAREEFIKDNFSTRNNGGVITIDGRFDYQNLESKPYVIDAETRKATEQMVHSYFGTNDAFVKNEFTSEQYEAVYEGRLEPFAQMLTQAFTSKLFTEREQSLGSEVTANMAKLKYQPMTVVTNVISNTKELGLFTRDEYREMLGYEPLGPDRGGDEIMIATNNYEKESENE